MRSKLKIITLVFVLLAIVLVPSCFAATVLEDAENYTEGAIIYGSTRFDTDVIITAGEAFNAGINESKVWVALGNKLSDLEPVTPYFYDGASWYKIVNDEENPAVPVTEENDIKEIEDSLHIFFVNNEMKTIEVPYEGTVDAGSVTEGAVYDEENQKFVVPALSFDFEFTSDGAEVEVKTNVDTNKKEENTGNDIKEPEIINRDVAAIGDVKYEDLATAFAEAKSGDTVKLLADVDIPTAVKVDKKVTLNLNGKKVTAKNDPNGDGLFMVVTGGDLTIEGEGTLDGACQTNNFSMVIWAKETGKVTINGGTYTNVGAKSIHENGKTNNNDMIYARGNAVITINGGTFIGNTENVEYGPRFTLNLKDTERETSAIIVKGGTFTGFNPADNLAEGKGTNFVAEGYKSVYDKATNTYTVVAYDANNVTDEAELKALLTAGGTVKLGADIEFKEKSIGLSKDAVLDLNGYTLSVSENYTSNTMIYTTGTLTVKDSSNGKGTMNTVVKDSEYVNALWAHNGGKITIENGNYIGLANDARTAELVYVIGNGSEVKINGGYFEGDSVFTLNLKDEDREIASIIVKGGTYTGFNPADNLAEGKGTNFVAEGYKSVYDKATNTYTVVAYDANNVTEEAELKALVAEGKSVKLGADIELASKLDVKKDITLDLNGKTLKAADTLANNALIVAWNDVKLTITGNGTVNSATQGSTSSIAVWAFNSEVVINGGTFTNVGAKYLTSENVVCNNELIYVSGTGKITINGGTFIGNTDNKEKGTRYVLNSHDTDYNNGTAEITVKGGTYTGFNPGNNLAEGPNTNFLAEGYVSNYNEATNTYTVVAE